MNGAACERYMWLAQQLETDPEYLALMQRLRKINEMRERKVRSRQYYFLGYGVLMLVRPIR